MCTGFESRLPLQVFNEIKIPGGCLTKSRFFLAGPRRRKVLISRRSAVLTTDRKDGGVLRFLPPKSPQAEHQVPAIAAKELQVRRRSHRGIHGGRIEVVRDIVKTRTQRQPLAQQRQPELQMEIELEV